MIRPRPSPLEVIKLAAKAQQGIDQFQARVRELDIGTFWDNTKNTNLQKANRENSVYGLMLQQLRDTRRRLIRLKKLDERYANRLLMMILLVRYLEERTDSQGHGVFPKAGEIRNGKTYQKGFFEEFAPNAKDFTSMVRAGGNLVGLFDRLAGRFQGDAFELTKEERAYAKAEQWLEEAFQTRVSSDCLTNNSAEAHSQTMKLFLNCVEQRFRPRWAAESLKTKLQIVEKANIQASRPTDAVRKAVSYLDFLLENEIPKDEPQVRSKTMNVQAAPQSLDPETPRLPPMPENTAGAEIKIPCPKCRKVHSLMAFIGLNSEQIQKYKSRINPNIDDNDVLVCDNCKNTIDLKSTKAYLESQSHKTVAFK